MAVLLFDGFDLHVSPYANMTVSGGIHDYQGFPGWGHGSPTQVDFTTGYGTGRAMRIQENFYVSQDDQGSSDVYRFNFFMKLDQATGTPNNTYPEIISVGPDNNTRIGFRRNIGSSASVHTMELVTFSGALDREGTVVGNLSFTVTESWAHYEILFDVTNDLVQVWKNNDSQGSETGVFPFASDMAFFRIRSVGSSGGNMYQFAYDHFIVSNGDTFQGTTGIHAVAVTYSAFSKDAGDLRVRGRIRIGETDYYATPRGMFLRGGNDGWSPRASNVYYDYWMTNPATSAAWSGALDIHSWGVCRTDSTGGWAIFPTMALTYIEMVDGYPEVKYNAPNEPFLLDGPWVRTDDTVPWNAHVDNYPRTYPPYDFSLADSGVGISADGPNPFDDTTWNGQTAYDDLFYEDYIGVTGPGCITFLPPAEEPEVPVIPVVGFTFAEEYRDTYKDWESIISGGDDFCSYFITGYKIHGDGNKKFQSNYLTLNYETHALGSAYVQGVWDYALANTPNTAHTGSDTGRWGTQQQVYGPTNDTNYKHAFRKVKIRGHGKALQLRVKCEEGKPFFINGWAMFVTGNSTT